MGSRPIFGGSKRKTVGMKRFNKVRHLTPVKPLTICIAARCEVGSELPKIVFCADRMISAGLQFEHGVPKVQWVTQTSLVMTSSSDSLLSDGIAKKVQTRLLGKTVDIEVVANTFREECLALKTRLIEQAVLTPLGLTHEALWKKSGEIPKEAFESIIDRLEGYGYDLQTKFMVFGIDKTGDLFTPHIFLIDQDGNVEPQDFLGFCVIGSGDGMAFPEMTKHTWTPDVNFAEALVRVYNSKKAAERVGGVGKMTDLYVLHVFQDDKKVKQIGLWNATEEVRMLLDAGIENTDVKDHEVYETILSNLTKILGNKQTAQQTQSGEAGKVSQT